MMEKIHDEYRVRYGEHKTHTSFQKVVDMDVDVQSRLPSKSEVPDPPQAMLDEFKQEDYVEAYRDYFSNIKYPKEWCTWDKGRDEPEWIGDYSNTGHLIQEYQE